MTAVRVCSDEVKVVNASSGGMLLECALRLPPGTENVIEIVRTDAPERVRGRVVRCQVIALTAQGLRYLVAFAFNNSLDWIENEGRLQPAGVTTAARPDTVYSGFVIDDADVSGSDPALALNCW